ncbi:MAG: YbaK/EbsC family protein [Rhodospirillaceae bacterium]|nr:YbaK/EbsC family protein [Rhodospirillaceae bacterium]
MERTKSRSVERVRAALSVLGIDGAIKTFDQSTRTAAEAAEAVGCEVGQIAKSLIFRAKASDRPVLVIARGDGRVNEKKISQALGEKIGRADPEFVRERTGFAIGGVAPVGHTGEVVTFLDDTLGEFATVWAAAGAPNTVFATTLEDLVRMTAGEMIDVS